MNIKIYALSTCLLAASMTSQAQLNKVDALFPGKSSENVDTVAWIKSATLTVGGNQGILHNWPAGGELASLTLNGVFNGQMNRFYHRHVWSNTLDMNYGLFYAYSNDFIPRKTDDRIDLTSKYGYRISQKSDFYATLLFNAKTQFSKAYNYDADNWRDNSTSNFLSPLYMTISPGIEYRQGTKFSLFFSPAAARFTFVDRYYTNQKEEGAFGVKKGENMRFEVGAYMSARYNTDIVKDVISYRGRLDLYSNYLAKDLYDNNFNLIKADNPGNIDIMFDNFISFKFYKYFSVSVGLTAIYDNDVPYKKNPDTKDPFSGLGWWQIKQFTAIGFNYKF